MLSLKENTTIYFLFDNNEKVIADLIIHTDKETITEINSTSNGKKFFTKKIFYKKEDKKWKHEKTKRNKKHPFSID
jgi:hypothetical protein